MPVNIIKIKRGNVLNGHLTLSDNNLTKALRNDFIRWIISPNSGVECIDKIELKNVPGNQNVFATPPYRNDRVWTTEVKNSAQDGSQTHYSIEWTDLNGNKHLYDPVIAIKPGRLIHLENTLKNAALISLAAISICLLLFSKHKTDKYKQEIMGLKKEIEELKTGQ